MVPRIIHLCWFGRGEKPAAVQKCIDSWKKCLPDYRIMEWNEDNFPMELWPYAKEAYDNRQYAFVSDVARLHALYLHGGIYMDTDMEVIASLDSLLEKEGFIGFERPEFVAAGIIGTVPGAAWIAELLDAYKERHFILPDGTPDTTTNVKCITEFFLAHGLKPDNTLQEIPGVATVYPSEVFYPQHPLTGRLKVTSSTLTIHHYLGTWKHSYTPVERFRKSWMHLFGEQSYYKLRALKLKLFPKHWK